MNQKIVTNNEKETRKLGEEFAKSLKKGDVVALFGGLGNGKTTFVQGLAKGLGIEKRIISPTFIIVRSYKINSDETLYHVDLYRTRDILDARSVGIDEIMSSDSIVVIEWAEKIKEALPQKRFEIHFKYLNENDREIEFKKYE